MTNLVDQLFGVTQEPHASEWFLMGSPLYICGILALYALFIKKWGPNLMKNRKAFELRGVLMVYNILQVILNAYLTFQIVVLMMNHNEWSGRCVRLSEHNTEGIARQLRLSYGFCMLKVLDLLDTVFFVLRKRYNQVTFLHFYHHIMVCASCAVVFQYASNGPINIIGLVNCFVHVCMYFYYLISSIRPDVKNSLWWKKYITIIQIVQFIILVGYLLYPLLNGEHCGYVVYLLPFVVLQNLIMMVLFIRFYIKAYIVKSKPKVN